MQQAKYSEVPMYKTFLNSEIWWKFNRTSLLTIFVHHAQPKYWILLACGRILANSYLDISFLLDYSYHSTDQVEYIIGDKIISLGIV